VGFGMSNSYARSINSGRLVEEFVDNVLKIREPEKGEAINLILAAEKNMKGDEYFPTITHSDNRDYKWKTEAQREELRVKICEELSLMVRLDDDENICLGCGGALPKTSLKNEKKAYYIIGAPASGKSGISSAIADISGAYLLDSDFAKRKLPEYSGQIGAASLIHEESDTLVFSYKKISLFEKCLNDGLNMVIPKIGSNLEKITEFSSLLTKAGYEVFLILVDLDREKATRRAYERFKTTKRYVPLSLIFDVYANEPTLNYYRIKNHSSKIFAGYALISTDVPKGDTPKLIENKNIDILNSMFLEEKSESKNC
jgi:shikimate kinase